MAIVGQSGSGKSTCMNIIGCLDVPTQGTYLLNGRDVGKMNRNELAAIRNEMLGFIFQQYNLLPKLNLMENVEVPLVYAGVPLRGAAKRRATRLAGAGRAWAISSRTSPTSFPAASSSACPSPGLWRATRPSSWPTSPPALWTATPAARCWGCCRSSTVQGHTVVLITHDNSIAVQAQRIIRLEDGRVVYDGDAHAPEAVVQPNLVCRTR